MTSIKVKVPTRIDLAGGTIDLWPLHTLMNRAATVNVGITVFQKAEVNLNQDSNMIRVVSKDLNQGFETSFDEITAGSDLPLVRALIKEFWDSDLCGFSLETSCESPAGAGLGGSSCLSIAIASALTYARAEAEGKEAIIDERRLVATVQNLEARIINAPTGCQDYWGGVRGRVNILDFKNSGMEIETFHDDTVKDLLDEHMIVAYSGKSRDSAMNNWQIFKNVFDGDKEALGILTQIGELGFLVGEALKAQDVMAALDLSEKEWSVRKQLWAGIETKETKAIDTAAKNAGAIFSRVCGAGGGGVMVIFCKPEVRKEVCSAIEAEGATVMNASISSEGISVQAKKHKLEKVEPAQFV